MAPLALTDLKSQQAFAGLNLEEKQKSLSRTAGPAKLVSRNFRVPISPNNWKYEIQNFGNLQI